jgi:uncharacterized protein (DUF1778 family)
MSFSRITIPLSEDEQKILRMAAHRECRRPHDHARFILLSALRQMSTDQPTNANTGAEVSQAKRAGVAEK